MPDAPSKRREKNVHVRRKTPVFMQMEGTECGAASLGSILAYHGVYQTLEELRKACDVSRDGSNALALVNVAKEFKLAGHGVRADLDNIAERVVFPAIIFWKFNHFLVLEGVNTKKQLYYLNDPAQGRRTVTREEFDGSFTGIAINFSKEKDFKPLGAPPKIHNSMAKRLTGESNNMIYITLITLMVSMVGLVVPVFSKIFIDDVLIRGLDSLMRPLVLAMIVTFIVQTILISIQYRVLALISIKLALTSSARFMNHIFGLPLLFFAQRYAGDIADRIASNDRIAQTLANSIAINIINVLTSIIYGTILLFYNYVLGLIVIFMVSLNFLVLGLMNEGRTNLVKLFLKEKSSLLGVSMNGLNAISTLKANGIESVFFKRWSGIQAHMIRAKQTLNIYSYVLVLTPTLLSGLTVCIVVLVGSNFIIDGALTVGGLIAFQALAQQFMGPISNLIGFGAELQQLKGDLDRLDDVLSYKQASRPDTPGAKGPSRLYGKLEVSNLSFGYKREGELVLEDINFTVEPGNSIAIVGPSGSGKSTLLKLLSRLHDPRSGDILYDEQRATNIDQLTFGRSVSMVSQEIILFEGSVRDNLTLWDKTIEDVKLGEALADVGLLNTINKLPGNYNYQIKEGGRNFSGGQRQCLEIARALVTSPSLIILDEATSALDTIVEQQVMEGIKRRCCSLVIVAHRLSTVRDADRIVVLEKGKIVQGGSHEELVADKDGPYYKLISHH